MADELRDTGKTALRAEEVAGGTEALAPKMSTGRAVAVALAGLAVFAVVFIGLVLGLAYAAQANREDVKLSAVSSDEPWSMLVIGSDSRKGTAVYTGDPSEHAQVDQHADIVTLVRVDPQTFTVTLVTIPCNTVVSNQNVRIKDTFVDGDPTKVVEAAEWITGTKIPYYLVVNFSGFEGFVNELDGVVVDVPATMELSSPITALTVRVEKGSARELNGEEALVVVRDSEVYKNNADARRQKVVRAVEKAMIGRALGMQSELQVEGLIRVLEEGTEGNLDLSSVGSIIMDFIRHADQVKIYTCTGPYKFSRIDGIGSAIKDDPATWREIMLAVNSGEDPSSIVPEI